MAFFFLLANTQKDIFIFCRFLVQLLMPYEELAVIGTHSTPPQPTAAEAAVYITKPLGYYSLAV